MKRLTLSLIPLLLLFIVLFPARGDCGVEKERKDHLIARDLMIQGNEQLSRKEWRSAYYTFEKALRLLQKEGPPFLQCLALTSKGEASIGLKEPQIALMTMQDALARAEKLNDSFLISYVKGKMGGLFESMDMSDEAISLYRDAFRKWLEPDGALSLEESPPLAPKSQLFKERLIALLIDQGNIDEAYGFSQMQKARPAPGASPWIAAEKKEGELKRLTDEIARLSAKARVLARQKREMISYDEIGALDGELKAARNDLEKTQEALRILSPQKAAIVAPSPLSVADILFVLGKDDAVLDFYQAGDSSFLFYIDESSFHGWKLEGALDKRTSEEIEKKENLIIVPSGMNALPPTLFTAGKGVHLIENHDILYAFSIGLWVAPLERDAGSRNLMVLCEGIPDRESSHMPLPQPGSEILAISALHSPRVVLRGSELARFDECLGRASLVHIAAEPLGGTRIFTGSVEKTLDSMAEKSGGAELFSISFPCSPAQDDLSALGRFLAALFYGGTRSFIMTAGDIPERERIAFFTALYRGLGTGASMRDSFREAQLLLNTSFPESTGWQRFILISRRT
jgi:hypothetical protein